MYTLYGPSSEAPFTRHLYCFTISVRGGRGTTLATIIICPASGCRYFTCDVRCRTLRAKRFSFAEAVASGSATVPPRRPPHPQALRRARWPPTGEAAPVQRRRPPPCLMRLRSSLLYINQSHTVRGCLPPPYLRDLRTVHLTCDLRDLLHSSASRTRRRESALPTPAAGQGSGDVC